MRNTLYLSIILALSPCSVPMAAAAAAGSLARVMGRPTTKKSEPAATAWAGVMTLF